MHFNLTIKIILQNLHLEAVGNLRVKVSPSHCVFFLPCHPKCYAKNHRSIEGFGPNFGLNFVSYYAILMYLTSCMELFELFIQIFIGHLSIMLVSNITVSANSLFLYLHLMHCLNLKPRALIPTCSMLISKIALLLQLWE